MRRVNNSEAHSGGAVLLLAMVFLVLLAALAGTAMRTSILEFRMAANDQFREEAFQQAQAIASAISDNSANFTLASKPGTRLCKVASTEQNCDQQNSIVVDDSTDFGPPGVELSYFVERKRPLLMSNFPLRKPQHQVSSSVAYGAAVFEAHVIVDGTGVKLGRSEVVQGIALLVPRIN